MYSIPILSTLFEMKTSFTERQLANARGFISFTPSGSIILFRALQSAKAFMPISLTELAGMLSSRSFVQPLKAFLPIAFVLFGKFQDKIVAGLSPVLGFAQAQAPAGKRCSKAQIVRKLCAGGGDIKAQGDALPP